MRCRENAWCCGYYGRGVDTEPTASRRREGDRLAEARWLVSRTVLRRRG